MTEATPTATATEKTDAEPFRPAYLYGLHAEIVRAGWHAIRPFCEDSGVNYWTANQILNGWRRPSPGVQQKLKKALGITQKQLNAILKADS
jgi:hypothetical protein